MEMEMEKRSIENVQHIFHAIFFEIVLLYANLFFVLQSYIYLHNQSLRVCSKSVSDRAWMRGRR
jgi:hypothetical protein